MKGITQTLHWIDYLVVSILLLCSCVIGIYYAFTGDKQKNPTEYLMANRKMHFIPSGISTSMTLLSAVLVLGVPVEVYNYGAEFWICGWGIVLSSVVTTFTFVPLLFPLKLSSSYEYLELRFQSKASKFTGSLLLVVTLLASQGTATYAASIALEGVSQIPLWGSILGIGFVATFYTTLGGIKAVVWADTLQSVLMVIGQISMIVVGCVAVGGFSEMWKINKEGGRLNIFNFDPDPTVRQSFWSLCIGITMNWLPRNAVTQTSVQRFSMVPTLTKAKWSTLVAAFVSFLIFSLTVLCGMVMYAYYSKCDPLRHPDLNQRLHSPNEMVPFFVMQALGWPGVPGLFLTVLFSSTLSTISSMLNGITIVVWEDFLKPCLPDLPANRNMIILKTLVVTFGVTGTVAAFLLKYLGGTLIKAAIVFMSGTSCPIFGMFLLRAIFPWANWLGSVIGGIMGLIFTLWISFGAFTISPPSPKLNTSIAGCIVNFSSIVNATSVSMTLNNTLPTDIADTGTLTDQIEGISKLYTVSYLWIPPIGIITTVVIGLIVSAISAPFIDAPKATEIEAKYLLPVCDWMCCCVPERIRNYFPCQAYTLNQDEVNVMVVKLT